NHSYEENIARLYSHWEHYLNNGGGQG
ncbi:DUF2247 domain-containing protein, partial [Neisseria gonorrhoeae]